MDDLPLYVYEPLHGPTWIRVLALQPSEQFNDPLRCNIQHLDRMEIIEMSNASGSHYEPVSYTWGEPNFSHQLICNNNAAIPITENVDIMLRTFRKVHRVLNLWVDAICLDQKNVNEIQEQVPKMGEIYSEATKLRAWTGPDNDGKAVKVFSFFKLLVMTVRRSPSKELGPAQEIMKEISQSDIENFLMRQFFRRRWIIQEIKLGMNIVCYNGREKLSWLWIKEALRQLSNPGWKWASPLGEGAEGGLVAMSSLQQDRNRLLDLLWDVHTSDCLNPHDRLFALYGLANDLNFSGDTSKAFTRWTCWENPPEDMRIHIEQSRQNLYAMVDYGIGFETVYTDFAKSCVLHGYILDILIHQTIFGNLSVRSTKLPSWVPDWSQRRISGGFENFYNYHRQHPHSNFPSGIFYMSAQNDLIMDTWGDGNWIVDSTWNSLQTFQMIGSSYTRHHETLGVIFWG